MEAVRRWLAIRSYRKRLGRKLRERYGAARRYTPAQVKRTIDLGGFNAVYICYAICMYCDRGAFEAYHLSIGEHCDYDAMCRDLGDVPGTGDALMGDTTGSDSWTSGDDDPGDYGSGHGHDGD